MYLTSQRLTVSNIRRLLRTSFNNMFKSLRSAKKIRLMVNVSLRESKVMDVHHTFEELKGIVCIPVTWRRSILIQMKACWSRREGRYQGHGLPSLGIYRVQPSTLVLCNWPCSGCISPKSVYAGCSRFHDQIWRILDRWGDISWCVICFIDNVSFSWVW